MSVLHFDVVRTRTELGKALKLSSMDAVRLSAETFLVNLFRHAEAK